MRNLAQYPITVKEVEDCLHRLADEIAKEERVGDMRPLFLKTAASVVARAGFAAEPFTKPKATMGTRGHE